MLLIRQKKMRMISMPFALSLLLTLAGLWQRRQFHNDDNRHYDLVHRCDTPKQRWFRWRELAVTSPAAPQFL